MDDNSCWFPFPTETTSRQKRKLSINESLVEHFAQISLDELPCEEVQTGFMCDIGMENRGVPVIQRLIATGMTVTRVKMSNIDADIFSLIIQSIRKAVFNYSTKFLFVFPLAIMVDVQGPEILLGALKNDQPIELIKGNILKLTTNPIWRSCGIEERVYIKYNKLTDLVKEDVIYVDSLNSEKIKLIVQDVSFDYIKCDIAVGGLIGSNMGVHIMNVPQKLEEQSTSSRLKSSTSSASIEILEHISQQIAWAIDSDVDAILMSRTQSVSDISLVKDYLGQRGRHILVIASIDTEMSLRNFDEILSKADGIYLDRISLSKNFSLEKIFIAQKMVMAKCKYHGKPCICRVVMNEKLPSVCASDVSNMIMDGADVLSVHVQYDPINKKTVNNDEAILETEQYMSAISMVARHTERILWQPRYYSDVKQVQTNASDPSVAICISAVELSLRSLAVVIICLTTSGRTAKILSHIRPSCPVIAVTRAGFAARQLRFWKGIRTIHYFAESLKNWSSEVQARVNSALDYCEVKRIVQIGDPYVVISSSSRNCGYCDSVKLQFVTKARVHVQ